MRFTTAIIFLFSICLLVACSSSQTAGSARDGSSMEKAIRVNSVEKEYEIARKLCADCQLKSQSLTSNERGNKHFDVLTFIRPNGEEVKYYFDISSFFGRF